jgi:protein involved in polysaccharide export with SLBB domain
MSSWVVSLIINIIPVDKNYQLQIGDEIIIAISGRINFTFFQQVSPEGCIFLQSGGMPVFMPEVREVVPQEGRILSKLKVVGMSLGEVEKKIENELFKYFKSIKVVIGLKSFGAKIYVEGAVTRPGKYPYFYGKNVQQYIGEAGGALPTGDVERVRITTPNNKVINGELEFLPPRNSIIYVPYAFVYVRGEVKTPGSFSYHKGMKVEHYIGKAGGLTERGNLKKSYVIRKDGIKIPLNKVKEIEKNDIIVIKRINFKWWEDYFKVATGIGSVVYLLSLLREIWGKK